LKWGDLKSRVDERVTITGTALNAASGAIVSLDGRPVYVAGLDRWPQEIAGRGMEVTGRLVFHPAPEPEGPVVHKLDDSYELQDASWTPVG
jgi:hypothetical protein